jgi:hypothetical protein
MTDDSSIPPPEASSEPTVLDLYKSVTKDWHSFRSFVRSLWDARRGDHFDHLLAEESQAAAGQAGATAPADVSAASSAVTRLPWRPLLALGLALYAQVLLEPPGRITGLALPLYLFAAALVLWAYVRGEWRLPALPPHQVTADPLTARLIPLFASVILALLAFWDFDGDRFTLTNVTLWTLSIGLLVFGLWLPASAAAPRAPDPPRLVLYSALLLGAFGLAMFFRLNHLQAIPAEPFSDHAEKILDIYDITQGKTAIFFPRNTGREALQIYWTWLVARVFGTGLSFLSLKLGTALLGLLTLPYVFLLGRELGGARLGFLAVCLFGIGYWPNLISRMGLRFPLYPLFVAPTLFHLMRGLRTRARNDFIWCGLFLGLGLHGYSPFRIVPLLVVAAFGIFLLHRHARGSRQQSLWWLTIIVVVSLYIFLPLLRYALEHPTAFSYRALSRLAGVEAPLPGPPLQILLANLGNALLMFNWDNGEIWVHSVPHRPAFDVVTAALFVVGLLLLVLRYTRGRDWRDLLLLLSIPALLMPSILSLAFPGENPALNRAAGAVVPAILLSALALEALVTSLGSGRLRTLFASGLTLVLLAASALQNYDLVFRQFDRNFRRGAWNSSEMGQVISAFRDEYGQTDTVWIVPYPHWVDTRLPGIWAGIPNRDFALWPDGFEDTRALAGPKLIIFWPEDTETMQALQQLYPRGELTRYQSRMPSKDFMEFFVAK